MKDRVEEPAGEAGDLLREVRPRIDRLDMEQARARAERSLFGSAAPARFGRYVLLDQRSDGGMGVVHAAYDPELHRKVALKLMHPRQHHERAHECLLAEARALAKLDHPNVVKVHDVITHDDQVVLVMEWVEGETLAAWERAAPRSWREVLPIYLQAGQGLAAAHRLGIVHRDFKPDNAIVGADGHVRILDFGLARPTAPAGTAAGSTDALAASSGDAAWPANLTATGALVGTFAYSSPEQLQGIAATPASDQFSFAVSLHRAIEGVQPFTGHDLVSRFAAIQRKELDLAHDGRAVPTWLRAAIARSLAAAPEARFLTMQDLLTVLARPRGWRRWRIPAALGVLTIIAALALLTRQEATDPFAVCDGGASEIDRTWNPTTRARLGAAFESIAGPLASDARSRVLHGLDVYRDRWIALHRDACVAHRRGEQSAALLDRRMLCMRKHLLDFESAVAVLSQVDAASVAHAVDVVARAPAPDVCADLERVQSERPPPPPEAQAEVTRVRARLSEAAALDRIGRTAEALALARGASSQAERIGYAPLLADASLLQGRILLATRDMDSATAVLARTVEIALQHRELAIAVEAGARKIYTEGMLHADLAALKRDADFLLPLSLGLPGDRFARPLLLNNVGAVYQAAGDRAQAFRYFQAAHDALIGGRDNIDPELTCVDVNLASFTVDPAAREALARDTWTWLDSHLGPANLATLNALSLYARLTVDPARALPLLGRACDAYTTQHPGLIELRTYCESYRAFLAEHLGDHDGALRIYDGLITASRQTREEDVLARATLATGSAALLRGDLRGAALAWQKLAEDDARSPYWWIRVRAAHAEVGLGTVARLLQRDADAAAHFERAIGTYREIAQLNEESEYRMRLALAQAGLDAVRHDQLLQ